MNKDTSMALEREKAMTANEDSNYNIDPIYERQFLEQCFLRGKVIKKDNNKFSELEKFASEASNSVLATAIQSMNLSETEITQSFLKYAKRDEELIEDLAEIILNGEKKNFEINIFDRIENVPYEIKHHIKQYKEKEKNSIGITRVEERLKNILPSLKAKFRRPSLIAEEKIRDASGIKVVVKDYDHLMRTLERIYTKIGNSENHTILETRIHGNSIEPNDINFMNRYTENIKSVDKPRYKAVHINVQNGGRHNIAEIQVVIEDWDHNNTNGNASHEVYAAQKAIEVNKYNARGLEVVCTYEIDEGYERKETKGQSKVLIELESKDKKETIKYCNELTDALYTNIKKLNPCEGKIEFTKENESGTKYKINFNTNSENKKEVMKLIDAKIEEIRENQSEMNKQIAKHYKLSA